MTIAICAARLIQAPPADVFALALDTSRFPATFTGFGPIPALRRITLHGAAAVGATRDVESSDGTVMTERITALDPPRRHAYTLSGLRPPLAWLVRSGEADWRFDSVGGGTKVTWRYVFTLTSPFVWPLASLLLHTFMRGAMQRCLDAMRRALDTTEVAS